MESLLRDYPDTLVEGAPEPEPQPQPVVIEPHSPFFTCQRILVGIANQAADTRRTLLDRENHGRFLIPHISTTLKSERGEEGIIVSQVDILREQVLAWINIKFPSAQSGGSLYLTDRDPRGFVMFRHVKKGETLDANLEPWSLISDFFRVVPEVTGSTIRRPWDM